MLDQSFEWYRYESAVFGLELGLQTLNNKVRKSIKIRLTDPKQQG